MKKLALVLIVLLCGIGSGFSAGNVNTEPYIEARIGAMFPWGTGPGFRGGAIYGIRIDSMVSMNFGLDYYRASYTTAATNKASGAITTTGISSETLANLFMGMINLRIDIPVMIADVIQPYVQIGTGYEILINTYKKTSSDETLGFIGDFLAFQLEAGAHYNLGEKSYLFATLGYNFATVSRIDNTSSSEIIGQKIDVGGFSVLLGIGFKM